MEVSAAGWRDDGSAANDGVGAGAGGLEVGCEAGDGGKGAGAIGSSAGRLEVSWRAGDGGESAGAEGASGLEVGCGGEVGGERHPLSCGICLFLAKTAARLLDQVASLTVFARLRGEGAGCGDGTGNGDAGCGDSAGNGGAGCGDLQSDGGGEAGYGGVGRAVGNDRVLAEGTACPVVASSAVAEVSLAVSVWRRGCER